MIETVDVGSVARVLAQWCDHRRPDVLLTVGHGVGDIAEDLVAAEEIDAIDLGLPSSTVDGRRTRLVAGRIGGLEVLVQHGTVTLSEGFHAPVVTACLEAAAAVGVSTHVLTDTVESVSPGVAGGDLVCVRDHLNLTGASPLVGRSPLRFADMGSAYDVDLARRAHDAATARGELLHDAVYAGVTGPERASPAEARMLAAAGADVVGTSVVCEAIAARAHGLRVLALAGVTRAHRFPADDGRVRGAVDDCGRRLGELVGVVLRGLAQGDGGASGDGG